MEVFWVGVSPSGNPAPNNKEVAQVCETHFEKVFGAIPTIPDSGAQLNWFYADAGAEAKSYPGKILCYTRVVDGDAKKFSVLTKPVTDLDVAHSDGDVPAPDSPVVPDGETIDNQTDTCGDAYSSYSDELNTIDSLLNKESWLESDIDSARQDLYDSRTSGSLLDQAAAQSAYNSLVNQLVDVDGQLQDARSNADSMASDASASCDTSSWPAPADPVPWEDADTSILG
jgi:hypothetical protein